MGRLARSLGCTFVVVAAGCAGGDDTPTAVSFDSSVDTFVDTSVDSPDTTVEDSGSADTAVSDAETSEAGCTGALCADGKLCRAGGCVACMTSDECVAADPARRCIDGVCKAAACSPTATPSGCIAAGAVCCVTESSPGTCFSRPSETSCCDDTACAALIKTTKCNLTLHACGCPAPTPGTLHVAPTGVDSSLLRGNGSVSCPFKTIGEALFFASGAAVPMTIVVHADTAGPATYGTGCTGGSPCDVTPLVIPATIDKGLTIKGSGTGAADVLVTGDGGSVFDVRAPSVSFNKLTIRSSRDAAGGGGHGIIYNAPASTTEGTVSDVVIRGKYATSTVAGTGTSILLNNGASPTLGPGLTLEGGLLGINITADARPTVVGSAAAPTLITTFGDNCLRANSTSAIVAAFDIKSAVAGTKSVTIRDCGSRAVSLDNTAAGAKPSTMSGVIIEKTTAGGAFDAIVARTSAALSLDGVDIKNIAGRGIVVDAGLPASKTVISAKNVTITSASGVGALFQGYATVAVDGMVVSQSASIGVQVAGFVDLTAKGLDLRDNAGVALSVSGNSKLTSDGLLITGGVSHGVQLSGSAVVNATNSDIRGTTASAFVVQGFAKATVDGLIARLTKQQSVRILENGELILTKGDVRESVSDGLRCEGSGILKVRESTFLLNKANGVVIVGACEADLGTSADAGLNVFNKTSLRNTTSGLCFAGAGTRPTPSGSTFGCGVAATGCTAGTPLTTVATACAASRDITSATSALSVSTPKCCFD